MKNYFVLIILLFTLSLVASSTVDCTPQQAKTAANVTVRVADDACREVADAGVSADWINLACSAVDAADTVRVLLPRQEWHAIRARKAALDAGPGK